MTFNDPKLLGKKVGNFQYSGSEPRVFLPAFGQLKRHLPVEVQTIFAPKCNFTTNIAATESGDYRKIVEGFSRSRNDADGCIIGTKQAGVIFNADCPIIVIFDGSADRLAILHGGFRCLIPEKNGEVGIIEKLFRDYSFMASIVDVFVGFGIGPCCFGAEHLPEVRAEMAGLPLSRAIRGPRKGQKSLDLYRLIRTQLLQLGVPKKQMEIVRTCIACEGRKEYYSNCYDGMYCGRNAATAWLT